MADHTQLIDDAMQVMSYGWIARNGKVIGTADIIEELIEALEKATADRAEVEAQALEQAADTLRSAYLAGGAAMELRERARELRARAVEIREGRQ